MNKLIYQLFLIAGLIASSIGLSPSNGEATSLDMKNQQSIIVDRVQQTQPTQDKIYFSDMIGNQDNGSMIAWHSSHVSHSSHRSHYSHRSSY